MSLNKAILSTKFVGPFINFFNYWASRDYKCLRFVSWRNLIFNVCVLMTVIQTIEGGQNDALLRRANV